MNIVVALLLSLSAVACSGTATPNQPTSLPSSVATVASGSALEALTTGLSRAKSTADQCKNNGYQTLVRADGTGFRNQGDCESYTKQGGTFGGGNSGNVIYTLHASGTVVGDFGWSLATTDFISTTTTFSSFLSTSSSAGCTISSVTINNPLSANPFPETFFSPYCVVGGVSWGEVAQTFWNAGPFASTGVYSPQNLPPGSPVWTLTITRQ